MIREISTVQNVSNANIARKKSQYFVSIKIRIMLSEIMDKNSADKYVRRTKFSADIIFDAEPNFRQLYPPNFCPIRYSGGVLAKLYTMPAWRHKLGSRPFWNSAKRRVVVFTLFSRRNLHICCVTFYDNSSVLSLSLSYKKRVWVGWQQVKRFGYIYV